MYHSDTSLYPNASCRVRRHLLIHITVKSQQKKKKKSEVKLTPPLMEGSQQLLPPEFRGILGPGYRDPSLPDSSRFFSPSSPTPTLLHTSPRQPSQPLPNIDLFTIARVDTRKDIHMGSAVMPPCESPINITLNIT